MLTYEEAVTYISEVPKFTKKNGLSNTEELLRRLGDPQEQYRVIHVAGTNGKGSVCAFMATVLEKAGYRTGLFTSPHLVRINERFRINGQEVSDDVFARAFDSVKTAIDSMMEDGFAHPTYFEILFAMGAILFAWEKADYVVMETGMGGRLDATRAVLRPVVCVITSISLDHMEYLGDTVAKIAFEKAGIIREGVPVVYDARCQEAAEVIAGQAAALHAPAWPWYEGMSEITERTDTSVRFVINNRFFDYREVTVPFVADYQVANASLAMMALRVLDPGKTITDRMIQSGIAKTRWSGRMETVLPGVVLDGAHNADGIRQFLKTVNRVAEKGPVSLLFAAVAGKEYEKMIRELCEEASFSSITVTQVGGYRKTDARVLAEVFRRYADAPVHVISDAAQAFRAAVEEKKENETLFCAGSLYLIGEIRAALAGIKVQEHRIDKEEELND